MALSNRIGSVLKQVLSRQTIPDLSLSNSSMYQAFRSMSSSKLFVGGLSYGTDETSLKEVFHQYGDVVEARIIMDRDTGRSRGFGFVTFTSGDSASAAMQNLDGQDLHGRNIKVSYATEKPRAAFGGGGGGGGGYGGGGYSGGGNYNSGYSGGGGYNSGYSGGGGYNSGYSGGGGGYNSGSGGYTGGGGNYGSGSGGYTGGGGDYGSAGGGYGGQVSSGDYNSNYTTAPETHSAGGTYGVPPGGNFSSGFGTNNNVKEEGAESVDDDVLDDKESYDGNYRDDDDVEGDGFANNTRG
ncbi:unnamed protein product [Cuscuta campestris]|uniref:RRM domain-containing protein n=1 Tax=Cuscuta campestris TaxID=132261 RepID=A0A484KT83_9ASTE|nr:unnamed protein product [Cuscuta campestris]